MFERYTQPAKRIIFIARSLAWRTGSPEIAPHHLLLGLFARTRAWPFVSSALLGPPKISRKRSKQQSAFERACRGPLRSPSPSALNFAAKEANRASSRQIGTGQCLLGLLREGDTLAARMLHTDGVSLDSIRASLAQDSDDDSTRQQFTRERPPLPADLAEVNDRIESIKNSLYESIANRNFEVAREHSEAESAERDKLSLLCRKHGFMDWIFY